MTNDGTTFTAYTLGYAESYDAALAIEKVMKQPGGYAFICREAAESYLLSENFALDFPGRDPSTFKVYGLRLTVPFEQATEQDLRCLVIKNEAEVFALDPEATA